MKEKLSSRGPDLYIDGFSIHIGVFGVTMLLSKSKPDKRSPGAAIIAEALEGKPREGSGDVPQVTLRMSLHMAKTLVMLLRNRLKSIEAGTSEITLPEALLKEIGVSKADW